MVKKKDSSDAKEIKNKKDSPIPKRIHHHKKVHHIEKTPPSPKHHKKVHHKTHHIESKLSKFNSSLIPQLKTERDTAMDFAEKLYKKFDKMIKSVVLFGSAAKDTNIAGSDIDIIIIIDDASIRFDDQLILWYRDELGKLIQQNPYKKELHINTIKLTTWWNDFIKGDPVVLNIIRYGEPLIDFGGFFSPLKLLLQEGRINSTPEAMYNILNRVPEHIMRSKIAEMSAIEGCYWAMIESAQALLMTAKILPPSPEHIALLLKENFVDKGLLKMSYVTDLRDLYNLHRKILHNEVKDIDGRVVDSWQNKSEDFFKVCMKLIKEIIE
ncbi:MAG: nucleotidyltransferase domain-containing protein [Nanoarchaeota archaeon]